MSGTAFLIIFISVIAFIMFVNAKARANGHKFKASDDNHLSINDMSFDSSCSNTLGSDFLDNTMISGKW